MAGGGYSMLMKCDGDMAILNEKSLQGKATMATKASKLPAAINS